MVSKLLSEKERAFLAESKIFTKPQLEFLLLRLNGMKVGDATGVFSSQIKPKIVEMLEVWFPLKSRLEKVLIPLQPPGNRTYAKKK